MNNMKKKIGDLTMFEIAEICQKQSSCESCPLSYDIGTQFVCKHEMKVNYIHTHLNDEIEVVK